MGLKYVLVGLVFLGPFPGISIVTTLITLAQCYDKGSIGIANSVAVVNIYHKPSTSVTITHPRMPVPRLPQIPSVNRNAHDDNCITIIKLRKLSHSLNAY